MLYNIYDVLAYYVYASIIFYFYGDAVFDVYSAAQIDLIYKFNSVGVEKTLSYINNCYAEYRHFIRYNRKCFILYFNYYLGVNIKTYPFISEDFFIYDYLNLLMVVSGFLFFLSSVISVFSLSYLGLYGVFKLNFITLLLFWLITLSRLNFFFVEGQTFTFVFGKWFTLFGHLNVLFELYIDSISFAYILLTLTIAFFVFIYVFSYFRYEPNVERLLLMINFFVISMILLVSSGNLFVLFLGWELIGLTSFLLINFWSTRISTLKAAFKAYVFNKFSDVSLFIVIILLLMLTHEWNISVILNQISLYSNIILDLGFFKISYIELISFFFIIAAFIKSAQFGFHIWLPDSMEAPAPASALIHSATLVSAGVFLILRFAPIFEISLYAYLVLALIGSFTAFFGGVCAVYQSDVKRILAYSTISHCGFLMLSCTTKTPELTIFYLYVHGFFKAAVFLCVGNIIRFSINYQDFKKMGGYWKYLPFECICSLICFINLAGLPFTLGFFIKHILFAFLDKHFILFYIILGFVLLAALSGLVYSYRLYSYVFFDYKKGRKFVYNHTNNKNLNSKFYSNTTQAANISILLLLIVGYFLCIYLYFILFSKCAYSEAFDIMKIHSSNFYKLSWAFTPLLNFLSVFNWLVIQIIIILIYSTWRYVYFFPSILSFFVSVTIFSVFVYFTFAIFGFFFF